MNKNHQEILTKRREYYRRNRAYIRRRDNAGAKRLRQQNPEKYKKIRKIYNEQDKKKDNNTTETEPWT